MQIDLHSHSTYSDGTDTPEALLWHAKQAGVDMLALTDHDSIAGLEIAKKYAKDQGICLIAGVEISCVLQVAGGFGKNLAIDKVIHIVGLNFNRYDQMNQALAQVQNSRADRGRLMVEKLAHVLKWDSSTVDGFWSQVLAKANGQAQAVARPHIAQSLQEFGLVKDVGQAFDKFLADGKPAYVAIETFSMGQAVDLIHACGGKAVLAHPTRYKLSATRIRKMIELFTQLGGDACELPDRTEPISQRQMIDRCIEHHGLKVSIGSDYHGSIMPWRKLGDVPRLSAGQIGIWEAF